MNQHTSAERLAPAFFAAVPDLAWDDLETVHAQAAPVLANLAANRPLLRELVLGARDDERIWRKCEEGVVEDKIVLWDEPEHGFRLRLRMCTRPQEEMVHQHRFSFVNYVLRGSFLHRNYDVDGVFDEHISPDQVSTICIHEDVAGHCFTIHHAAPHSTPLPGFGTINLVLRGPAMKDRAPVLFNEARGGQQPTGTDTKFAEPEAAVRGHVFWRIGEKDETPERRAERQMSDETYRSWVRRFEEFGLI